MEAMHPAPFLNTERLTILAAAVIFAAIAWYFPLLGPHLKKRRIKPPHTAISVVFRLWFAALALASLVLFFFPHRPR